MLDAESSNLIKDSALSAIDKFAVRTAISSLPFLKAAALHLDIEIECLTCADLIEWIGKQDNSLNSAESLTTAIPVVKDFRVSSEKALNLLPENLVVGEKALNDRRYRDSRGGKTSLPVEVSGSFPKVEEILTEAELLNRFNLSQNWRSSAPHGWVHEFWLAQKLGVEYLGNDRYQLGDSP